MHENNKKIENEMKEAKKITNHPRNEHKMYPRKTQYGKNQARR
jgi:hypothetical protein